MPELPEVETTRVGLLKHTKGQLIQRVTVRRADLREPIPKGFAAALKGVQINDMTRRSKYLLIHVTDNSGKKRVVMVHLGMSGSMRITSPDQAMRKHDHVIFSLSTGEEIRFHDPRRFGLILLLEPSELKTHKLLKNLGPEPLSRGFNQPYVRKALAKRQSPIKTVLMDAKFVVGVGNIYASESLFLCGIHPLTPANHVGEKANILIQAIRKTLKAAIRSGGSTLRDYVQSKGETGYFQHEFRVYGRKNEDCIVCGNPVIHAIHSQRSTYWCEVCQPYLA